MRSVRWTSIAVACWVGAALSTAGCSSSRPVLRDAATDAGAHDGQVHDSHPADASDDAAVHEAGAGGHGNERDASPPTPDAAIHDAAAAQPDAATDASQLDASDAAVEVDAGVEPKVPTTRKNLRLAFFGDQGYGPDSEAVLRLVKSEHADLVIHAGDFDYGSQPLLWEAQLDSILGHDFPYFAAVGNHDIPAWAGPGGYQELLAARVARIKGAECTGDLGVNSVCKYRGLAFVLSGVGTYGTSHEAYLAEALATLPEVWKICVWHKNQHDMQVGYKIDEVGWLAYQTCERRGALILTGHEHSYSRTYTLSGVGSPEVAHGFYGVADQIVLEPGSTAVVVSGLGGLSARVFAAEQHPDISWWASIYARNYQLMNGVETGALENIEYGALFIDLHVEDDPYKARAYFKTVSGAVVDSFEINVTP